MAVDDDAEVPDGPAEVDSGDQRLYIVYGPVCSIAAYSSKPQQLSIVGIHPQLVAAHPGTNIHLTYEMKSCAIVYADVADLRKCVTLPNRKTEVDL